MSIKCVVSCTNSNGEPDFWACYVGCNQKQYDNGDHYEVAKQAAEAEGYEPHLVYDENDPGFAALTMEWAAADVIDCV
jgi:hypothetical protein